MDRPLSRKKVIHRRIFQPIIPLFFVSVFYFTPANTVRAQHHACATPAPSRQQLNKFENALLQMKSSRTSSATKYISIQPFIVRNSNGQGGLSLKSLNQLLVTVNNDFKGLNVEFYFSDIKYIDDSKYFDFHSHEEDGLAKDNDVSHSINIYFLNSIQLSGFGESGGYAYYPGTESYTNRIFISNSTAENGHMLSHELGHYFGLLHTFERDGGMELVSRGEKGNCYEAGDRICDTEADPYGMDGAYFDGCNYTGRVKDLNGESYNPPVDNIMSYYISCANRFTPEQFDRMEVGAHLRTSQASYNLLSDPPVKTNAPGNLAYALSGKNVLLSWNDNSDNETGFIVERSVSPEKGFEAIAGLAPNTVSFVDHSVLPEVSYYYRVKVSNSKNTYSNIVLSCPKVSEPAKIDGSEKVCRGDGESTYTVPLKEGLMYEWWISGGGTIKAEGNTAKVKWSLPGVHTLTVIASNACEKGPAKSMHVQVYEQPAFSGQIDGEGEVCFGSYSYSIENHQEIQYKWEVSGGGTISGNGNKITVKWDKEGEHTLKITPASDCGEMKPITKKVKVSPFIGAEGLGAIQARSTSVCPGPHQYQVNFHSGVEYEWSITEGSGTIKAEGNIAEINWSTPGNYTISVAPANACGNTEPQQLQVKVVEIPEKPVISIEKGRLTSNQEGEHLWFLNGEPISGAIGPICPSTLLGNYTVQLINPCGQGPLSDVFVLDKQLPSNELEDKIFLFPNPASSRISVELPDQMVINDVSVVNATGDVIFSIEGRFITENTIRGNSYKKLLNVDVEKFASGLYYLKIHTSEGIIGKRIIVKK